MVGCRLDWFLINSVIILDDLDGSNQDDFVDAIFKLVSPWRIIWCNALGCFESIELSKSSVILIFDITWVEQNQSTRLNQSIGGFTF